MRVDDEVVGGGIAGDDGFGRLREAAREAGLVAERVDEARADGLLREGLGDCGADVGLAVGGDEAQELVDLVRKMDATTGDLMQIGTGLGTKVDEAVAALGPAGAFAAREHHLDVRRVLDIAAAVPAARVRRHLDAVADDADARVVGAKVDGLADVVVRDRVGIRVEADARLFGDNERDDEVGVEGMLGQRAKARALDEQALRWALARGAVQTLVCGAVAPGGGLGAHVVD